MAVVDALEVVKVDEQQRKTLADRYLGFADIAQGTKSVEQVFPVEAAGQGIGAQVVPHLVEGTCQLAEFVVAFDV